MAAVFPIALARIGRASSRYPAIKLCTLVVAMAGATLSLGGCKQGRAAPGAAPALQREGALISVPEASPLRQSLAVQAVAYQDFTQAIDAPGVIEALPEKRVTISPPLAGRVVKVHRSLGDTVRAGDALATLDSAELGEAFSEHEKAQLALADAGEEFQRQKALHEEDISARRDLEAAQVALSSARSEARAMADRLAQAGVSLRSKSRREYVLRSPIAGVVVEMTGSQGAYWNDIAEPVMTVADLSKVWVSASVPEKDLAHMFVGQQAQIRLNAHPGRVFEGRVKYVGDLLDTDTRTALVRVELDNRDGLFKPGMFARVGFVGANRPALLVPATALLQSGLYTRVFVEQAPFRYASRIVQVGVADGDRVEVREGLKPGERIVVRNGVLLND